MGARNYHETQPNRSWKGIPEIQGFENTVRDNSEKVNGIRDLFATRKAGFAKMWTEDTGLGEKTINRGLLRLRTSLEDVPGKVQGHCPKKVSSQGKWYEMTVFVSYLLRRALRPF